MIKKTMHPDLTPMCFLFFLGDCCHQQSRHLGPGSAAFGSSGQEDRVPDAKRRGPSAHHADPLAQDERESGRELRGAGPLHRRLQRRAVQGRVRGSRHDRAAPRRHRAQPRGLHGGNPGGAGQEEGQPAVLRLTASVCVRELLFSDC